jgi:hypothetical protein
MDVIGDPIAEEQHRLRRLRGLVDFTAHVLAQARLTRAEGRALVTATRRRALELFPDKAGTFDLILAPRFARLIDEFSRPSARVLRFPRSQAAQDR